MVLCCGGRWRGRPKMMDVINMASDAWDLPREPIWRRGSADASDPRLYNYSFVQPVTALLRESGTLHSSNSPFRSLHSFSLLPISCGQPLCSSVSTLGLDSQLLWFWRRISSLFSIYNNWKGETNIYAINMYCICFDCVCTYIYKAHHFYSVLFW